MTPINPEKARAALDEERRRLVHQLEELGADESGELTGTVDFGDAFADAGAATSARTGTLGLISNLTTSLRHVDRALARIDDGTYGICIDCHNPISEDRLEFRPTSVRCIDCKAAAS